MTLQEQVEQEALIAAARDIEVTEGVVYLNGETEMNLLVDDFQVIAGYSEEEAEKAAANVIKYDHEQF